MNEEEGNEVANDLPTTHLDDEDEEELPELVFGTASVPIFSRVPGQNTAGREAFAGTSEAYQPLRSELIRLVTNAHEARDRKAAMEAAAAKQAEKEAANADDGQTTIDERSTNQAQLAGNATNVGTATDGHRVSASETIDSETAAMIGSNNIATVPTSHQEGLGNVVGRMMMPELPCTNMEHHCRLPSRPLLSAGRCLVSGRSKTKHRSQLEPLSRRQRSRTL